MSLSYFTGAQCDNIIANATNQIEALLQTPQGVATVNSMFKLCTPLNVRYVSALVCVCARADAL